MAEELTIVEEAKKRFKQAEDFYSQSRHNSTLDREFVFGDCYNLMQYPEYVRNDPNILNKVKLTINLAAQHCNQVINNIRMNRPHCKVIPLSDGATKESAEVFEGYIRSIQSISNADDAHDQAAEYNVYSGEGYWRVVSEYLGDSFRQVVRIVSIPPDCTVYIDPNAKELDKSDAEWAFVMDKMTKEMAIKAFGEDVESINWGDEWSLNDEIIIADYYYCDHKPDILELYEDGTVGFKSEQNDKVVVDSRKQKRRHWYWCKLIGGMDEPYDKQRWLGGTCPIISSLGKQYVINGVTYFKGMARDLVDQNRMVNFSASKLIETSALQPNAPFMAPTETFDKYKDIYATANSLNHSVLPYESYNDEGQPLNKPERAAPPMVSQGLASLIPLFTEQMRGASGQSNANFGIKSEASSGIGIQRLKQQGEIATFHYPDNHARALRYEMRVLIDLLPHYIEDGSIIRTLGLDGKEQSYAVSSLIPVAFQKVDKKDGKDYEGIWNPWIGRYDYQVITGASYQTQRQDFVDMATEMAKNDPRFMQAAGHLVFSAMDIPFSDELARIYEKMQPPELKDEESHANAIPMMQQQMEEMYGQMQQMQEALEQASQANQELQRKAMEKDNQALKAEADKIRLELKVAQLEARGNISTMEGIAQTQARRVHEGTEDDEDEVFRDPQLDDVSSKLEELIGKQDDIISAQQEQMALLVSEISKPKVAQINIKRTADGGYVGERIEH